MTDIDNVPPGTRTEWGVRFHGMNLPDRTFDYEADQNAAQMHVAEGSATPGREATLTCREVTRGPWRDVSP